MRRFRLRFSLRMMFVAMTVAAVAAYASMRPTIRAKRLVEIVETRRLIEAEAMLPASIPMDSVHRAVLRTATSIKLYPLTAADYFKAQRRVEVTGSETMIGFMGHWKTAEFQVSVLSISEGPDGEVWMD